MKYTRTYLPTRWVPLSDLSRPEWVETLAAAAAAAVEAQGQEVAAATAEPAGGALFAAESLVAAELAAPVAAAELAVAAAALRQPVCKSLEGEKHLSESNAKPSYLMLLLNTKLLLKLLKLLLLELKLLRIHIALYVMGV